VLVGSSANARFASGAGDLKIRLMGNAEMQEKCPRCDRPLTEIDYYGDSFVGCVECNVWRSEELEIKLPEEDLTALKEIDRQLAGVAQSYLAIETVKLMQAYLARGRSFQSLSADKLQERYVEIMQKWASAPTEPLRRQLAEDVHSEYALRNVLPPKHLVAAEIKSISMAVARICDELSEDRKDEIGADMFEEYQRSQKDRH
jgi:hypothetical protein